MILVFHWQFNASIFWALQHSTYAAIYDWVARAMFWEVAVLLLFVSEISPSDTIGGGSGIIGSLLFIIPFIFF